MIAVLRLPASLAVQRKCTDQQIVTLIACDEDRLVSDDWRRVTFANVRCSPQTRRAICRPGGQQPVSVLIPSRCVPRHCGQSGISDRTNLGPDCCADTVDGSVSTMRIRDVVAILSSLSEFILVSKSNRSITVSEANSPTSSVQAASPWRPLGAYGYEKIIRCVSVKVNCRGCRWRISTLDLSGSAGVSAAATVFEY